MNKKIGYELSYGSAPATYSVHGQPGGLARIDDILGIDLYGTTFGNSPLVFGAFPSLHSGNATIEMLFLYWICPKALPYCIFHVLWMWFATMYLTHHYLIDLVGGSIYAILSFFFFRQYLPAIRSSARCRLDYIDAKVPVKISLGNFIRSIEMEKFVTGLKLRMSHDTESALLIKEANRADVFDDPESEEDSTSNYDHIPLQMTRNDMYISTDEYTVPSTSTSPTCSGPPSPVTPHSHFFPHHELKQQ